MLKEILADPSFQSLLLNLSASVCYDFLKGTSKWVFATSENDFGEAVNETIEYFSKDAVKSIEILPEYFKKMFDDPLVAQQISSFESGSRDVSVTELANSFIKAGFYYEGHQTEKAEGIVNYFLNRLTRKILSDSSRASVLLFDTLQHFGKYTSQYGQEIVRLLHQMQGRLDSKMDHVLRGIDDIKKFLEGTGGHVGGVQKSVEVPSSLQATAQPPELELAIKLHNEGRLVLARQLYLEMLEKRPKDFEILWKINSNIGKTYLNPEEEKDAIPYFRQAYNYFPTEEKGKVQLAFALLIEGKFEEGLAIIGEILSRNPVCVDVVVIGANILVRRAGSGDAENAKQLFTPEVLKNHLSFYTFAWVLKNLGELGEAEIYYRKLLDHERRPEFLSELALCILDPIGRKFAGQNPAYRIMEEQERVRLNEVLALFNEAISKFTTRDEPHELAYAYLNRSVVFSFFNSLNECYDDCVQAEKLGLDVPVLFRNKGVALVMLDRSDEAVDEFKKAVDRGDNVSFLYYVRALMQSNQFGLATKVLMGKISYPEISMTNDNLEFYLIYSEILERELDIEGADEILNTARKNFPENGEVVIRFSNSMRSRYGANKAVEIILNAIPSVTNKREVLELMLADLYFVLNKWQDALEAYSKFSQNDYYDLPVSRTLICLFNLRKHAGCLEKLKPLRAQHTSAKLLRDLEARIYFEAEEFATASALYKDIAISFKDPDYYLRWGHCEFRLSHHDEAKRILNSAAKEFYAKADDLIRISGAFAVIGETKKALELAFRATSIAPESADAALKYFFILHQHSALHDEEGDVTKEQIQLGRDIGEHFEERFPGIPGLKKFKLPKPDDQMTVEDFTKIFKQEMPSEEYYRSREQLYLSNRFPVSTFSLMVGKDIIETWSSIITNSNYNVWSYDPQNFPKEEANINVKSIVAEPISILTLHTFNRLNLLGALFEKVSVPQRFLDTIQGRISKERISANQGSTELFLVGDSFRLLETSPDVIAKRLEDLGDLKEYLTDRVVGFPIVDNPSLHNELQNLLRVETIQAIEQSIAMEVPLLSDEAILSSMLGNKVDLHTISTYTILVQSLRRGLLLKRDFNKTILDLAAANYYFVPVNSEILLQGLVESNFLNSPRSIAGFRSIAHVDSDPMLDGLVIGEFLGMLFDIPCSDLTKSYWFDYALNCIPKIRFDPTILLGKIITHLDEIIPNNFPKVDVLSWVKSRISVWAKGRGMRLPKF